MFFCLLVSESRPIPCQWERGETQEEKSKSKEKETQRKDLMYVMQYAREVKYIKGAESRKPAEKTHQAGKDKINR